MRPMKVAIVHDYLIQYGGAERVVEALSEIFPQAPIYTSVYMPEKMPEVFKTKDIRTSFMQRLPFIRDHFKKYFLLYPYAFGSFDLSAFDIILTSSSAYAHGIKAPKNSLVICYCYTPPNFIWNYDEYVAKEAIGSFQKKLVSFCVSIFLKKRDLVSASGVHHFIAISNRAAKKIKDIYHRDSTVIYPPVDVNKFFISESRSGFFLIVSRLTSYKKIDVVIEAFNNLGYPLKIVGTGAFKWRLQQISGPNIDFAGVVNDQTLAKLYAECKALVFLEASDFGLAPLEAQSSGRPVIAFAKGGALETVIDGETGIFFNEQAPDSLIEAIKKFQASEQIFDPNKIRAHASRFDKEIFKNRIRTFVEEKYRERKGN